MKIQEVLKPTISLLLGCTIMCNSYGQSNSPEKESIIQVIEQLFQYMKEQDTAQLRTIFLENSWHYAVHLEPEKNDKMKGFSVDSFLNSISGSHNEFIEKMQNPTVLVKENVAVVWTPYTFYRGSTFSHCGLDIFTLIHTLKGWKISHITFTIQEEGCLEEP